MIFLYFGAILIFIALLIFIGERRSFIGAMLFGSGTLIIIISGILLLLSKLSEYSIAATTIIFPIIFLAVPIVFFAFGIYLFINSHIMRKKEGRSFANQLLIIFALNVIVIVPAVFALLTFSYKIPLLILDLLIFLIMIDLTYNFFFACYLLYSYAYQIIPVRKHLDFIIVLGAGIQSTEVTPLLKSRLDKGLEYYNRQSNKPKFIVSGGQGADEPISEALAMHNYLLTQQVPENDIIMENRSTTTYENMKYSKTIIDTQWTKEKKPVIIFTTNNFHVLRSALYARRSKISAEGVGAPTSLYFLPSALIREFIAILFQYWWFTLAIAISWLTLIVISNH